MSEIPKEIMEKFPVVDKYIRDVQFESGFVTIDENKRLREAAIFGYQLALASLSTDAIGWRKVEDGLPEVDTAVFVRTEYESSGKPMVDFFTAYMDEYGDTIICPHDESYGWQFNDVVTHWMPLPSKPNL